MDTRFLRTLLIVSDTCSLAATARQLNITPSAVVQRIKVLEAELGCELIKRSGHQVQPTAFALAIKSCARHILDLENDLRMICGAEHEAGELKIGIVNTAATGLFPNILFSLRQRMPGLELYPVQGTSIELYPQVLSRDVDAAIIVKPPFSLPKSVGWRPLRSEPLIVVASSAHVGADPLDLLRTQPFIQYDRNNWGGRLADKYLRSLRIKPRVAYELDSLEAITIMVDRGIGVSLIPDWCPPWPQGVALQKYHIADAPHREIGLVWTRGASSEHLISAFLNICLPAPSSEQAVTPFAHSD